MDYNKYSCPVCSKAFSDGDDIVVCPICGTPHHRTCFEEQGHCFNEEKHAEGFSFLKESKATEENCQTVICSNCKAELPKDSLFCNKCGFPVGKGENRHTAYSRRDEENNGEASAPQGMYQTIVMDPMGGLSPDTDIGEGVTVGEAAKFTKNNSPFYSRLFNQIKSIGRSRFSFVGFIFGGGWMLYRKMYLRGAIVTSITALLLFIELYCTVAYGNFLNEAMNALTNIVYGNGLFAGGDVTASILEYFQSLSLEHGMVLGAYFIADLGSLVIKFICGFCCNRWYYRHCVKKIKDINEKAAGKEDADSVLQTKGGVNLALAVSLMVSYLVISFLPALLL
ncbi:MAG: RING finger protein [Eubacteriales bacterium]|nr:RING finger protein [Eubacteriales bacterium]